MEIINIEENKNNIVVKHQELVHNARYKLSELSIKVLSMIISMVKVSDTEFTRYSLNINDFTKMVGSDSHNIKKYITKMTYELQSKPFWIVSGEVDGKKENVQLNWIRKAIWIDGAATVEFKIDEDLQPYLLALQKNFLQYNIKNILSLKSTYVIRLYELCKDHLIEAKRYKQKKQSVSFELKIDRIRELFQVPNSYQYSSHIKKNILDKAVKQFKEKTDIRISYTEQKIGRKVDRVIITVKENNKGSADYLGTLRAFIKHVRKECVNKDLARTKDRYSDINVAISVDSEGRLYDKKSLDAIMADRSQEMWETLYEYAKEGKIACLDNYVPLTIEEPIEEPTREEEEEGEGYLSLFD